MSKSNKNMDKSMEKNRVYLVSDHFCHSRFVDPTDPPRLALLRFDIVDNNSMS